MATDDFPITDDPSVLAATDMPADQTFPAVSKLSQSTKNTLTLQAAVIASDLQPNTPLADTFQEIAATTSDPTQSLKGLAVQKAQQEQADFLTLFKEQPGVTPEDVQENFAAVQDITVALDAQGQDEDLMFVRAASKGVLDEDTEKRLAVQLKVSKMMKATWDEMGVGDVVLDVLGLAVPGNILKDNFDISGTIFSAEDWMRNFVLNFKQLPPDVQLDILPTVQAVLKKDLDNNFKVLSVLEKLIAPGGEEDLSEFNAIWASLDTFDVATLGTATILKVARTVKALNAPRILEATGAVEDAADVATGAVVDASERVASAANLDRNTTAVNNVTGIDLSGIDPAQSGELATEAMERIRLFDNQVAEVTQDISGQDLFLRESLLQREERAAVEVATQDQLASVPTAEGVKITGRGETETVFSYTIKNPDGTRAPVTYRMQLSLDDVAVYEQSSVGILSRWAASPSVWAKKNVRQDVDAAIRADSAQAKVFNELVALNREAVRSILGPLGLKGVNPSSRKKLAQLDHVLRVGDEQTQVFTPLELQAGVDGVKLNSAQQEAYYKTRSLVDSLFNLRNDTKREELVLQGMRDVSLTRRVAEGEEAVSVSHIGKPFDTPSGAAAALTTSRPRLVWDEAQGRFISPEDIDIPGSYTLGVQLVRFSTPVQPPGTAELVNFALVRSGAVTPLPQQVLNRRVGYVPKINQDVSYFVKQFEATRVDGIDIAATSAGAKVSTLRFFDNKKEAEAWLAGFERDNPGVYRVLEDRQLEQERRAGNLDGDASGVGGSGLYTGPRAVEDIPFGKDGVPTERLGTFEAIGRNMSSVAKYVPRNAWRLGMEQRALNTANQLIPGSKFTSFSQLSSPPDTEAGRFIKQLHGQIEEWMGFPTKEEQLWSAMVQGTYDKLVGTNIPGMKGLLYLKNKDPVAAARSAAFHTLLGWFNPIQLWVQAQGAAVAAATNIFNPVELLNSIRVTQALAAADLVGNGKPLAHTAKAFGMKSDELATIKRMWEQTGLKDSILTTADHAAAAVGHGIAMDSLARASNAGLLFYRAGELFNRRLSFVTSLRKFQKENPGVAVGTDQLKDILTSSNNLMLGLTRANRAKWQKGIWSVPTQFLQISTKTMESLLGFNGSFTPIERGKILTAQVLLYGAAGIPLGGMGANWLAQSLGYTSQSDVERNLDPELRKAVNEGFQGWASMAMFGIDIDIGQRASLASGINQTLERFLFEDSTLAEQYLGAFGSSSTRFWRGMTGAFEPLSGGLAETRIITDPLAVVGDVAKTISTWNNASKGLFMRRFDRINDSKGRPTVKRDFSTSEEIATAIGFRTVSETQAFDLRTIVKAKEQLTRDVTDSIIKIHWDYSLKAQADELTPQYKEQTRQRIALMYQSLDTNFEREKARDAVKDRLSSGEDLLSKQWRKVRQLWNDGQVDMILDWRGRLINSGILQQAGQVPAQQADRN